MELTLDRDPAARILDMPVRELKLTLEGSPVERYTKQLVRELQAAGIQKWTPRFYLTDEWGCPSGQPIIGIPFYLADPALMRFERRMHDLESPREILMYLRHEAGHAINYAYRLYQTPEWRATFGPFRRRYKDDYKPVPFSRDYVRYLPGWYAQKHPDEDFAETFAVWLAQSPGWRKRYEKWPALAKLEYVERAITEIGNRDPVVRKGRPDITADEMDQTVRQMFEETTARNRAALEFKAEDELADIFLERDPKRKNARYAWQIVTEHRLPLTNAIAHWTGVRREVIRGMVDSTIEALKAAGYQGLRGREAEYLMRLTAYGTALAFSYFSRGKLHNL
jgi:Putative zinc-binding metallo-peptidase